MTTLEQKYSAKQDAVCNQVKASLPTIPDENVASFMQAYQSYNGTGSEDEVVKQARNILTLSDVEKFFLLPDSFDGGGLDEAMVKCAVLSGATPKALAEFAVQGDAQEALVNQLLSDTLLQRDMLVSGGARSGKYAEAMEIYSKLNFDLQKNSAANPWDDRSQDKILQRCALATAVEHAEPRTFRFADAQIDPVQRFTDYKEAYLNGDLDPNFEMLTTFECRGVVGSDDSDGSNTTWMRETLANYHPDHIIRGDVASRYMQAVHTDVPYQHPAWPTQRDYTTIPAAGGECGPRAWFGRFAKWAFGLPTWGHQQPGHAAMSSWTPKGWVELLGRSWEFSYWEGRGGPDFYLETQCREYRSDFQQVLRGQWVAAALSEDAVNPMWTPRSASTYGTGGLWNALMLYSKKITVLDNGPAQTRELQTSVVPTKVEHMMTAWTKQRPTPSITTDASGTITIPGAAMSAKNGSVTIMPSADSDDGQQLLHTGGGWDIENHGFEYDITVDEDSTYYLVANFSTWHMNLDLVLTSTESPQEVQIPVYWTHGHWMETQPIEVKLLKGKNFLRMSRRTGLSIAFKEFFLFKTDPVIPTPDPSDMPVPTPPPTPLSDYIQLSKTLSCESQGILELDEEHCEIACAYFGNKYTGARNRPLSWPGCFAVVSGPWAGNCNFNSNTKGTGEDADGAAVCSRGGQGHEILI